MGELSGSGRRRVPGWTESPHPSRRQSQGGTGCNQPEIRQPAPNGLFAAGAAAESKPAPCPAGTCAKSSSYNTEGAVCLHPASVTRELTARTLPVSAALVRIGPAAVNIFAALHRPEEAAGAVFGALLLSHLGFLCLLRHLLLNQLGAEPLGNAAEFAFSADYHLVFWSIRHFEDGLNNFFRIVNRSDRLHRLAGVVRRMFEKRRIERHRHDGRHPDVLLKPFCASSLAQCKYLEPADTELRRSIRTHVRRCYLAGE